VDASPVAKESNAPPQWMTYGLLLCLGSACAPRFSLSGSLSFPHSPFPFEPRRGGCKVRRWALFVRVPSLPLKGFSCGQAQPECLCARKSLRLVIIAASSHVGLICPFVTSPRLVPFIFLFVFFVFFSLSFFFPPIKEGTPKSHYIGSKVVRFLPN